MKAALVPDYQWQTWLTNAPLSWAQQYAESKAKLLESRENTHLQEDRTASWRGKPALVRQRDTLDRWGIPHAEKITAGEASNLISQTLESKNEPERRNSRPPSNRMRRPRRKGRKEANRWEHHCTNQHPRHQQGHAKPTRVPYNPQTSSEARSNTASTWGSYEQARLAYERSQLLKRPYTGLGYVFAGNVTGID